MVFDRTQQRVGFAPSSGLCSVNGSLYCGDSCNVVGPDSSLSSIFTPTIIGVIAAAGVVVLVAGFFCLRGLCRRWPPLCRLNPLCIQYVFCRRSPLEQQQLIPGRGMVSQPAPVSLQYR